MRQFDLTKGVIWKNLVIYSIPIVLSSLFQSAYSIVDLIVAGQFVGKAGISGINNASQVTLLLTQIITGITVGGGILISQYFGSRDQENRRKTNVTLFTMSTLAGLVLSFVIFLAGRWILVLLKAPALEEAVTYLRICAVGLLPIFGYNALSAMIRAVGNSRQPLYFIAITSLVNIGLDFLFIGGLGWGVAGAAWATVIAQTLSFLIALIYTVSQGELFALSLRRLYIKKDKLRQIMKLGIPSAIQMSLVGISWLTMTFLINRYGVEASAASGIATKIKDCVQLFTMAMASAASTFVAQCLGAEKFERAKEAVHIAMRITIGASLLLIVLVEVLAPTLVRVFRPDEVTAYWAVYNLRVEIIAQVFYASFLVYNALALGAGHTVFVLINSIMNSIVVRLILALILDHFMGLPGIFWACMIAPASSVPLGYLYERSGRWKRSLVQKVE